MESSVQNFRTFTVILHVCFLPQNKDGRQTEGKDGSQERVDGRKKRAKGCLQNYRNSSLHSTLFVIPSVYMLYPIYP